MACGIIIRECDQYKATNAHIRGRVKCSVKVLLRSYFFSYNLLFGCENAWKIQKEEEGTKPCRRLWGMYLTKAGMDMPRPKLAQFRISGEQAASF